MNDALGRALTWLVVALTVAVAGCWVLIAGVHVDDRFGVDHVGGIRIALADDAVHGQLYPELFDGERYGGTRFMPLPIVLHAGLAEMTGEYLVSGKALGYATAAAVAGLLLWTLRRAGADRVVAAGLVAATFTNTAVVQSVTGVRADLLPVLLQVAALAAVWRSSRTRAEVAAGVLAGVAFVAKLSAVWAAVAIVAYLAVTRRRVGPFVAAYLASLAVAVAGFAVASEGRLFDVVRLGGAGLDGPADLARGPYRLAQLLVTDAPVTWLLLGVGAVAVVSSRVEQRRLHVLGLAAAVVVGVVALADQGTGSNQLVDIAVLAPVVALGVVPRVGTVAARVMLAWLLVSGLATTLVPELDPAVSAARDGALFRDDPLRGRADRTTALLSEDPYVAVSLGQRPVVTDPFMLVRHAERRPEEVRQLVARIERREFDLVVLVEPLHPLERSWWTDMHFGLPVVTAIADHYEFDERVQGYDLYRPVTGDR